MAEINFFNHIPKSAGTRFKTLLSQGLGLNEIYLFYSPKHHLDRAEKLVKKLKKGYKIKLLMGHIGFGLDKHIKTKIEDVNFKYITILREPIARVVSMYKHIRRDTNHQFYDDVSRMSLYDYVASGIDESASNSQTRFLSGSKLYYQLQNNDDATGYSPFANNEMMYNEALTNIENHFKYVGITELFSDSVVLAKEKNIIKTLYFHTFNVSTKQYNLTEEDLSLIKEKNEFDIKLYNTLKTKFLEQMSEVNQDHLSTANESIQKLNLFNTRIKLKILEKVSK